jgi:hypothetical protein
MTSAEHGGSSAEYANSVDTSPRPEPCRPSCPGRRDADGEMLRNRMRANSLVWFGGAASGKHLLPMRASHPRFTLRGGQGDNELLLRPRCRRLFYAASSSVLLPGLDVARNSAAEAAEASVK